jgi:hypothetical protein
MNLEQFLLRMTLGVFSKPDCVHPARWHGMLCWYEANYRVDPEILDARNNHGQE